jgi:hypothetical protein
MTYVFAGFLVELIWELTSSFFLWLMPVNVSVVVTFAMDLVVLCLFLMGAYTIGREKKHFNAVFVISIILIATSCITTVLALSPVEVIYSGFTDLVPVVLGLMLTYQLIKGIMASHSDQPKGASAKRLMTYWKTSLWLIGGIVATFVVGLFTIMGALLGDMMGNMIDPEIYLVPDEALLSLVFSEVLPTAGPFLIFVAVLLAGLLVAYVIIRILFVVTVYQLKNVKVTPDAGIEPVPVVE